MNLLAKLVEEDFGFQHTGEDWGRGVSHDSLVVNLARNLWYWNSKHESGNTIDYLVYVRKMKRPDAERFLAKMSGAITSDVIKDVNSPSVPHEAVVDVMWKNGKGNTSYWDARGITKKTINLHRLGFINGWFTVPVYNDGDLVNIQLRRDDPVKSVRWWYTGTKIGDVLFQEFILKYSTDRIFIVEGLLDSLVLSQVGIPAVSPCGGSNFWKDAWFQKFIRTKEIFCVADNDEAGTNFLDKVSKSLGKYRVKGFVFSDKKVGFDSVDFFRDGYTADNYLELVTTKAEYVI